MRAAVAILAASLVAPATASAQVKISAVDGSNTWSPAEVTVKVGEPVTWSFAGTATPHNVKSNTPGWVFSTAYATAGPDATATFATPGEYLFLCELHGSTMSGKVKVTDASGQPAPPPPPPPLSEQPFANDTPPLSVLEVRDTVAPTLDRVKVSRVARGIRVRFRLSEAGKVAVKLTRGGRTVKTRTVEVDKGTGTVTLRGLKPGAYRVQVSAKDLADNEASRASRARVTLRRV